MEAAVGPESGAARSSSVATHHGILKESKYMKLANTLPMLVALLALPALTVSALADAAEAKQEAPAAADQALVAAVNGEWRSTENKARDRYRHPVESLTFWGLKPGMTILEIQPGSASWWTEILAPYARSTGGKFYATGPDLADPKLSEGARKSRAAFESRYGNADTFGKVSVVNWGDVSTTLPANTFDFILTARSIHGWMQTPGEVESTFKEFHKALKKGGILAVEQHRANPSATEKPQTGYVTEGFVIDQAEKAGFKLADRSEINANPKDTKDHPFGVWTLPPTLRAAPYGSSTPGDPNFDHSKYLAIGESDRMTLKFVKP
jgi:predicted methyltransferase